MRFPKILNPKHGKEKREKLVKKIMEWFPLTKAYRETETIYNDRYCIFELSVILGCVIATPLMYHMINTCICTICISTDIVISIPLRIGIMMRDMVFYPNNPTKFN